MRFREGRRGQSEVIGTVLMVGLVVVLVTTVGTLGILGAVGDRTSETPLIDVHVTVDANNVTVTHGGGEVVRESSIDVVVRNSSAEKRIDLEAELPDGDDSFTPGETATFGHSLTGTVEVYVVHRDSDSVVGSSDRFD
jgi:flagellin-like protein